MNKTLDANGLGQLIVDAVVNALEKNGVRYDCGCNGEIYIDLDGPQQTFCLPAPHQCEEYEGPSKGEDGWEPRRSHDTNGKHGWLLEFLYEGETDWKPLELANGFGVRVYDNGESETCHDVEIDACRFNMFKDYPNVWGIVAGNNWPGRLGIDKWNWKKPSECKGYSEVRNAFYRVRKVELGDLSDYFKEFLAKHPTLEVVEKYPVLSK